MYEFSDGYSEKERTETLGFGYCVDCGTRLRAHNMGEDGRCAPCSWPDEIQRIRKLQTLKAAAIANADQAVRVMKLPEHWARAWGMTVEELADFAADAARSCYRACLKYQLEGGQ